MPEELAQTALRCGQCNKPFDKLATLKRHGYYCRSRRVGRTVRSRSCVACARSKARCDNGQPSCSRCTVKAVECHYPCKTTSNAPSLAFTSHSVQTSVATSEKIDISRDNAPATWTPGVCEEQPLGWNDLELASLGESIDWGNLTLDVADLLDDRTGMAAVHFPMSSVSQNLEIQHAMTPISMSIPSVPNIYSPRSFVSRPERNPGQQRIVDLVLQTLKSYPLTIIHHNTLPPFVHPGFVDFHDEGGNTESLEICLSLMHMLGSKIRGSSKLFWKNVRWECERMREQHAEMNPWELLSAMQALSVYLLVRLQEGETEHNNYDSLMLTTVIIIAQALTRTASTCDAESTVYNPSNGINWKAWIFQESRRRLAVIYRVVNMLIYFEPADMCELQKELIIAPLPAKKQLWEADDVRIWEQLVSRDKESQEHVALNSHGELVLLDGWKLYCDNGVMRYRISRDPSPTSKTTDWEHWCSGMDGFGSLIMLAAALIV